MQRFEQRGLVVLGLNEEEDREREARIARELELNYPVLLGMQQVVIGAASAIGPLALGATIDVTDSYTTMLLIAAALQVVALVSFRDPA